VSTVVFCPNVKVDEKKRTAAAGTNFALFTIPPKRKNV
jgi:hypothetical protein